MQGSAKSYEIPAWLIYLSTRKRASLAWSVLSERPSWGREEVVPMLARIFDINPQSARRLLRLAQGVLWKDIHGRLIPAREKRLWKSVSARSQFSRHSKVSIPEDVLAGSLEEIGAFMSQGAMSRSALVPTSRVYTASVLGVSISTVTKHRRRLRQAGLLEQLPQYLDVRPAKWGTLAECDFGNPKVGEFTGGSRVLRRIADVVVLRNADGDLVDILGPNILRGKLETRPDKLYFSSLEELKSHKGRLPETVYLKDETRWRTFRTRIEGDTLNVDQNGDSIRRGTVRAWGVAGPKGWGYSRPPTPKTVAKAVPNQLL